MSEAALDARDLRTGGRWTFGQRLKNALLRALIRALLTVADRLPANLLVFVGELVGAIAYRLLRHERHNALQNIAASSHHAAGKALARACFVNAGRNLALCLLTRRAGFRASDHVEIGSEARECLAQALAQGRGAVFVSAHLGPFEWVAASIAEHGYAASVIVRESYDPGLDALVDEHRLARGLEVIHRGHPSAPLYALRALRAGKLLGLLPDLGGRVPTIDARFVMGTMRAPVGPARLARAARCPVLIGTLAPLRAANARRKFALEIQQVALGASDAETTQGIMDALARAISRAPAEWLWMAVTRRVTRPEFGKPLRLQENAGRR
jgi:KDO2-lipid IV(A) lauroyltransferase